MSLRMGAFSLLGVAALAVFLCANAFATTGPVWIYRSDGTTQCSKEPGISLDAMRKQVEALGVTVLAAEKRTLPVAIIALCGAPTGRVNTYEIAAADLSKVSGQFGLWTYSEGTVEVYKYDGTLQCGMGTEVSLDIMAAELAKADITVLWKGKASDGLIHVTLCGASTGRVNVFEINSRDLEKARKLGFQYYPGEAHKHGTTGHPRVVTSAARLGDGDDLFPWPW